MKNKNYDFVGYDLVGYVLEVLEQRYGIKEVDDTTKEEIEEEISENKELWYILDDIASKFAKTRKGY